MQEKRYYRQVPTFNLIPLEYRRPAISFRQFSLRFSLVLIIVVEIFLAQYLYQQKLWHQEVFNFAQRQIQQIDKKLAEINAQKEEAKQIEAPLEKLKKERESLAQDWRELGTNEFDWSRVLTTFFQSKPQGVTLSSVVKQDTGKVSVTGKATNYRALLQYRNTLLSSPVISRIISLKSEGADAAISFSFIAEVKEAGK